MKNTHSQDAARQRVIEALRRLSVTVDRELDSDSADLCQLAIGAMLEKLAVILPTRTSAPSKLVH